MHDCVQREQAQQQVSRCGKQQHECPPANAGTHQDLLPTMAEYVAMLCRQDHNGRTLEQSSNATPCAT